MRNTQYKIGVITNVAGQAMQDMTRTARENDVVFDQISFPSISIDEFANSHFVKLLSTYDIVYYRTGLKGVLLEELSKILYTQNIPLINGQNETAFLHLKSKQALTAGKHNIPQPKTYFIKNGNYEEARRLLGKVFIVKPEDGSKGTNVHLISSKEQLRDYRSASKNKHFIYQEYLENAEEYRVYALGGKAIAVYKKTRGEGEFRANLHTGGSITVAETERTEPLLDFGSTIATVFDADIAGIDILIHKEELYFLEINFQPGWEALEETTGQDFCTQTLQYILDCAATTKN